MDVKDLHSSFEHPTQIPCSVFSRVGMGSKMKNILYLKTPQKKNKMNSDVDLYESFENDTFVWEMGYLLRKRCSDDALSRYMNLAIQNGFPHNDYVSFFSLPLVIMCMASDAFVPNVKDLQNPKFRRALYLLTATESKEPNRSVKEKAALKIISDAPTDAWFGKQEEIGFHGLLFTTGLFAQSRDSVLLNALWKRVGPLLGDDNIVVNLMNSYQEFKFAGGGLPFFTKGTKNFHINISDAELRIQGAEQIENEIESVLAHISQCPRELNPCIMSYAGALSPEEKKRFRSMLVSISYDLELFVKET